MTALPCSAGLPSSPVAWARAEEAAVQRQHRRLAAPPWTQGDASL